MSAPAGVQLRLGQFASNKARKDRAQKGRLLQLGGSLNAKQVAGEPGVGNISLGRLDLQKTLRVVSKAGNDVRVLE